MRSYAGAAATIAPWKSAPMSLYGGYYVFVYYCLSHAYIFTGLLMIKNFVDDYSSSN